MYLMIPQSGNGVIALAGILPRFLQDEELPL